MAYKGHGLNFFRSLTHLQRAIISVFLFPLVPTLSFQIQMQPMLGSPLCSFIFSSPHFDLRETDIHFDLYNSFRPQTFNAWSKISIFGAIRKVLAWLLHWLMGQRSPILGILSFKGRWIHSKQDVHFFFSSCIILFEKNYLDTILLLHNHLKRLENSGGCGDVENTCEITLSSKNCSAIL